MAAFKRGTADCCAFVDHVIGELTGNHFLPHYYDDDTAIAILYEYGSLEGAVSHYMKAEPVAKDELMPGDVALVTLMDRQAIGVLMDSGMVAIVFEGQGLREIRGDFIDSGWRVWA